MRGHLVTAIIATVLGGLALDYVRHRLANPPAPAPARGRVVRTPTNRGVQV